LYLGVQWRWVALGASFIALQLFAGEPQMNCYTIIVAGAYGLFSLKLREEKERRSRFLFGAVVMAVCGALLSAIQLLPERELLQQGGRVAITYEYFSAYSFPPQHLFQAIFPYFFGGALMPPYKAAPWGKLGVTEVASYVGRLALMLGLSVTVGQVRRKSGDRLVWVWAAWAALSV